MLMILISLVFCVTANNCCVSSDSKALAKELKTIEKEIPLPYHHELSPFVDKYQKKALPELFLDCETFIEEELKNRQIPMELKYLPIALSQMQPYFEQEDRCGIWALPTLVGLHYGLVIDESHDERFSIEASTYAALDYLIELHDKYNDWWQAILAYSNSANALQHATSKSEVPLKIWDYYEQKLVPDIDIIGDYIACVVVYNDHERKETRATVPVIEMPQIERNTTVGTSVKKEEPKTTPKQEEPKPETVTIPKNTRIIKYKVKKGDTLSHIAKKYRVTISDIVEWNHLETDLIRDGQELIIIKEKKK